MLNVTKKMHRFLAIVLLVALPLSEQVARFDNYKVYRITPETEEQIQFLSALENVNSGYNFWSFGGNGKPIDLMVAPHLEGEFRKMVQSKGIKSEVFIGNVQDRIDNENSSPVLRAYEKFGWDIYHTVDEIHAWLKSLVEQYPNIVTLVNAGKSYEGRDLLGVHVSFNTNNSIRGVFLEGGIHAREWISPATVTYILNGILTSTDPTIRKIAEYHDWYVFPSVNPDGYVYTHTTDRLWRKSRKPYSEECNGTDPNRNWGFEWNTGGSSSDPCDETYAGPSAFSDGETKQLSVYLTGLKSKLKAYISFHSYSQLLLIPYGADSAGRPDNFDELLKRGQKAAKALSQRYGTNYTVGNIVDVIYVASGGSIDWVKGTLNTRWTYVYELRDTGSFGFVLPADQIIPTGEETLDSVIDLLSD